MCVLVAGGQSATALRLAAALSECITQGCAVQSGGKGAASAAAAAGEADPCRVILVASAEAVEDIAAPLRRCFTHELAVEAPDQDVRLHLLQVRPDSPWTPDK